MPSPKRSLLVVVLVAVALAGTSLPARGAFPPQVPSPGEVARLKEKASSSLSRMRAAQAELDSIVAGFEKAQTRLQNLNSRIAEAEARQIELLAQLDQMQGTINDRAASNYRFGPTVLLNVLLGSRTFRQMTTALTMFESVTQADGELIEQVRVLRHQTAELRGQLAADREAQESTVAELTSRQDRMQSSLASLSKDYESVRGRLESSQAGFAFPVRAPYSFVDTYGAPRSGYRRHQGVDIFAQAGTPIYAVVDGIIEDKGVNTLGGNKLWLRSPGDGWRYYYAHLKGFAPGIANGTRVRKGQVVGYVGKTGNARTTPNHLHFEARVPAGQATNPYPILRRVNLLN